MLQIFCALSGFILLVCWHCGTEVWKIVEDLDEPLLASSAPATAEVRSLSKLNEAD